jgi:phenylacetate-coenzyme A ligase PaaK-like adenylate-forming protein
MNTRTLTSHWDRLPQDELRHLQIKRLRDFLRRKVIPFSPHYRRVFAEAGVDPASIRSFHDLEKLPFTAKESIQAAPRDFVLAPDPAVLRRQPGIVVRAVLLGKTRLHRELEREFRPVMLTSTTGRSSNPVPFLHTLHDIDNLLLAGRRMMEVCRSQREFRHVNLFPFAPHLAFWLAHYAGIGFGTFCTGTGGGKVMGTDATIAFIDKIQPEALIGMPTFIYHVLSQAVAEEKHWPKLCRIVLGGEKVPAGLRRKLKALCAQVGAGKVDVMATYGLTEAKLAFPECPACGGAGGEDEPTGYHLYPDLSLVEIVDPHTGRTQPDGTGGEIVLTALDSRGTVVVRYRTGDIISGGISHEPCPACGRRCPRLLGRISRVSDFRHLHLDKIKGTLVDFNELEHVLDDLECVGSWQIEIRKLHDDPLETDTLTIRASLSGTLGEEAARRAITRRVMEATELRPNSIEFHAPAEMRALQEVGRALKEKKVADHRAAAENSRSGKSAATV